MKLGTGHTAQQCSTAYNNQRVSSTPQKPNSHTVSAASLNLRKELVSVAPLKSAKTGKPKHVTVRTTNESNRSSNDGSESETNCSKSHLKGRAVRSRRRKVKGHSADATTSEDSEMEINHGNLQAKPRPPPLLKEETDNQKAFETNMLGMEGDGNESLRDGGHAEREEICASPSQTLGTDPDTGNEQCVNCEELEEKRMPETELRYLRQLVIP